MHGKDETKFEMSHSNWKKLSEDVKTRTKW
jgi:hypothetical protein